MKNFIPILKQSRLFAGINEDELVAMLSCLQARKQAYRKGTYVLRQGDQVDTIMILAEGSLLIQRDDYWGNRTIISAVDQGDMFGEAYAASNRCPISNDVIAASDSTVIFFDVRKVLSTCSSSCPFHAMVVQNLFYTISEKNRQLVRKLGHLAKRTTREKLISYLSEEADRQGSGTITIPFNRQQLADFLSVDRSAMSTELGKMRDEGLITFAKNRFTLL